MHKELAQFFYLLCLVIIACLSFIANSAKAVSLPDCVEKLSSLRPERSHCIKQWSVLVFMAADNELSRFSQADLQEMLLGKGSDASLSYDIAVEIDTHGNSGSKRLLIENEIHDLLQLPEKNTADPKTLESFLQWAIEHFPAKQYAFIMWGHGDGWGSINFVQIAGKGGAGIAYDESSGAWLKIPQLRQAFARTQKNFLHGKPFNLYASDACFMQMAEVAFELRNSAEYIFGSAPKMDYSGLPYDLLFENLSTRKYSDGRALAKDLPLLVQSHYAQNAEVIASTIEADALPAFSVALNQLAAVALPWINTDTFFRLKMLEIIYDTQHYQSSIRDLGHFLKLWKEFSLDYPELYQQIIVTEEKVKNMIVSQTKSAEAGGISIWLPSDYEEFALFSPQFRQSSLHRIHWKKINQTYEYYYDSDLNDWGKFLEALYLQAS